MIVFKYLWYYSFWLIVRIGLRLYYSKVKVSGLENIPKDTPIIFGSNHENAFIDALLITTSNTRFDHYLVRSGVFKNPVAKAFFNSLNLMPVYRAQDGVNPLEANKQIFRACFEALAKKYAVMLFPEGEHNMRRHRRILKKGITRIALGAVNFEGGATEVAIVPVGVNYSDHTGFRSTVHIVFGQPIKVEKQEEKAENYNKLTTEITEALSKVHVSLDRKEYIGLDAIFFHNQDSHQLIDPDKINAAAKKLEGRTAEINAIADQKSALEAAGLSFPFRPISTIDTLILFALAPFAFIGLLLNLPVLLPVYIFIKTRVKEAEFVASLKFGFSLLGFIFWWRYIGISISNYTNQWHLGLIGVVFSFVVLIALNGFIRKWKRFQMTRVLSSDKTLQSKYNDFKEKITKIRSELF
ncbi:MAG: lysophospholipid acyltransferase family protein [Reichenbachiella sp.]|uniref:lysophospholipid acyltransferase family protein n=1 Tax=Reichenbachiella sp. TaxID=2184521 RepID=UPI00329A0E25